MKDEIIHAIIIQKMTKKRNQQFVVILLILKITK